MTNLLAALTFLLVTNTTEFNTVYDDWITTGCTERCTFGCILGHTKGLNPRAKEVTTEIVLLSIADVDFVGKKHSITNSKVMSTERKRYVRKTEWVEDKDYKWPEYYSGSNYFITNTISVGLIAVTNGMATGTASTNYIGSATVSIPAEDRDFYDWTKRPKDWGPEQWKVFWNEFYKKYPEYDK